MIEASGNARRRVRARVVALASAWTLAACTPEGYDTLLLGGRIVDGTGAPARVADVGLVDGRVSAIGDLSGAYATTALDVSGLYVSPGFIDVHSHAGPGLATPGLSAGEPLLAMGVTTVVINPDGGGPIDMDEQRAALEADGLGLNAAQLIGHGSVRRHVLGMALKRADDDEMARMRALVERAMEAGAWGLSSGTFYTPGSYAEPAELVELARAAGARGGVYTSHIRDESNYTVGVVAAVEEVIDLAREADVTAIVTHVKALGPPVWGASRDIVERIETARSQGVQVYADQYPYLASATGLSAALLPRWSQVAGAEAFAERTRDADALARIRAAMVENLARRGGADRIQFRRFVADPSIEGHLLSDLAEERGQHPVDLSLELILAGGPSIVSFNMSEDDLLALMTREWTMTSSDGDLVEFGVGVPHPRTYGAFARKIGKFALADRVMSLEDAVRSMTSLPADVMGMADRGRIEEGMIADVVVFSDRFTDHATFTDPHRLSSGVVHLFVGGEAVIANASFTGRRPGAVLAKPSPGG